MKQKIENLKNQAISSIIKSNDSQKLEQLRIHYLGRKGEITRLLKGLLSLQPEKKREVGRLLNDVKRAIEEAISNQQSAINNQLTVSKNDWLDVTTPGVKPLQGHLHLITQAIEEITTIFARIGFIRVRYPEVEWDWYAFEGLNMPENHPARDDFETFYLDITPSPKWGKMLLTPHTSSGQIREMKAVKPPIRMINIGKCYRPNYDISHTPMFHQFEGLLVDQNISITHLKGTCDYFAREYFGPKRKTRLRPFHFQFTEPSFELDISCDVCGGNGCRLCKEGWLELGGAGMVHPVVLKNGGVDPQKYTAFAFGWGIERVVMMKSGLKLPDLRLVYSTDLRILNQF